MKKDFSFSVFFNFILSRLAYGVFYLIGLLPLSVLYAMCRLFYFIGWKIIGYRKSVIIQNLTRSFPDKNYVEIDSIAESYSSYLFSMFAEWIKSLSESNISQFKRVHFKNPKMLEGEESVFLLMGHYGNWESLNMLPFVTDKPVYGIYQEQHSSISDYFCHKMRNHFGSNCALLESKQAVRFILQNQIPSVYLFIADQSPPIQSKIKLTFLNQPTIAFEGVERLAIRTKGRVLYTEVIPLGKGFNDISFSEIGLETEITKVFFNCLQQTILRKPQYWLWSHRRWKHKVD